MEIATKYNPSEVEDKWYRYWMENRLFHSEPDEREPFTIVIPPPNVTGVLHMGHMLNNTIQDVLIRRARMQGKNACWVPGTDHASIATEAKVVGKLAAEGIKKTDLSREEFLAHAWEWTHKHGGIILEQLKKLGCSCDWDRTAFTMDDIRSESVIKVFCDLYDKGKIYRGVRMVNWDPSAQTAVSDEEVIYTEENSKLYYVKYKIVGENGFVTVATTRPETILGDTAVCINPNDERYAHLKGKKVLVPLTDREAPIILDEYVEMEFGTGCLKVTPAHDINDYELGIKHNLSSIDIFNDNGTLNQNGGAYAGIDRFEARQVAVEDLQREGLIHKIEDYKNKVGRSERTHSVIEPKLSMQWFLKMNEFAAPALGNVENDTIKFVPEKFKNTYRHWLTNIKDWCISRQLWWGHQIPAYYFTCHCEFDPQSPVTTQFVVAETKEKALEKANEMLGVKNISPLQITDLRQDEDCLDTWFSSWLWPISVFDGINSPDNKEINYYYPTNDLVTGPDIIFFWVARMIMAGYEYRKEECFKNVYFTGIVRDKLGRKMSKQLGNSPDPIELMNKYGADGVRMGMLLSAPAGNDIHFDEALCEQGRNFCNKIWNALRLVKGWEVADVDQPQETIDAIEWFYAILVKTNRECEDLFSKYRLSEALMLIYKLFWDDFCAWYLEIIKPEFGKPMDEQTYGITVGFFKELLKLLHPFMPFITEELYHTLEEKNDNLSIMIPSENDYQLSKKEVDSHKILINDFETVKEIITNIRNIRASKNISPKEKLTLQVSGNCGNVEKRHCLFSTETETNFGEVIKKLANIETIKYATEKSAGAVSFMVGTTEYAVPVGNLINAAEEIDKMKKEIARLESFLKSVQAKLGNEKFVANAKPEVVEIERKKQADAENKIQAMKESISSLK